MKYDLNHYNNKYDYMFKNIYSITRSNQSNLRYMSNYDKYKIVCVLYRVNGSIVK